jgi:hypothetical protein
MKGKLSGHTGVDQIDKIEAAPPAMTSRALEVGTVNEYLPHRIPARHQQYKSPPAVPYSGALEGPVFLLQDFHSLISFEQDTTGHWAPISRYL